VRANEKNGEKPNRGGVLGEGPKKDKASGLETYHVLIDAYKDGDGKANGKIKRRN